MLVIWVLPLALQLWTSTVASTSTSPPEGSYKTTLTEATTNFSTGLKTTGNSIDSSGHVSTTSSFSTGSQPTNASSSSSLSTALSEGSAITPGRSAVSPTTDSREGSTYTVPHEGSTSTAQWSPAGTTATPAASSQTTVWTGPSTAFPSSPGSAQATLPTHSSQTPGKSEGPTTLLHSPASSSTTVQSDPDQVTVLPGTWTIVSSSPKSLHSTATSEMSLSTLLSQGSTSLYSALSPTSWGVLSDSSSTAMLAPGPTRSSPPLTSSAYSTAATASSLNTVVHSDSTAFPGSPVSVGPTLMSDSAPPTVSETASSASYSESSSSFLTVSDHSAIPLSSSFSPLPYSATAHSTQSPLSGLSSRSTVQSVSTTTHSTAHAVTLSAMSCFHGGSWNGNSCTCRPGTTGRKCEYLVYSFFIDPPEVINGIVPMKVKVIYRNFTEDLKNKSSLMYLRFTDEFKKRMNEVFNDSTLPQYKEVIITDLANGSIVVKSDVVLETNYIPQYKALFRNLTRIVRAKIMNETSTVEDDIVKCQVSKLCYNSIDTTVDEAIVQTTFDPQEQCIQKAAEGYGQYYYAEELNGQLTCVTRCTPGWKDYLNCNLGECQLQRSGPHCLCPNTDSHWYWGETCELNISKSLVYGLVGVVLAVLVIVVLTLAVFLSRSQRRLHSQEYNLSQEWRKEGIPGSFQNKGVWEDRNLQDRFSLENAYSRFQPSLGTVNPAAELHFQRPEVVKTTR
ncbi:PREDICTED: mucin-12-like isoform X2 [Chinchilla lanigera]|uniref:mucin-12-like isoform X2 n=1 Tax=Chinchilla lanigera TaxID=34839 RepID=UPI000698F5BD|nr:PREDICTED: mucin-12-like isoform X2 [Chinchilla lanigera]